MNTLVETVSTRRLKGQRCPDDLIIVIEKCRDILEELGIKIEGDFAWAPWADKSYLTETDLQDPEIVGNIRAIDEVCEMVSFVAESDEGEFIGYWRGPDETPINEAGIVYYDTEGMFYLCGSRFVDALFVLCSEYDEFEELKSRLEQNGIALEYDSEDDIPIPNMDVTPDAIHTAKYEEYRKV